MALFDRCIPAYRALLRRLFKPSPPPLPPVLPEPWLSRVTAFINDPAEPAPRTCSCKHTFQGTGVFYQSIGVIQCASCRHWQVIRKPVK